MNDNKNKSAENAANEVIQTAVKTIESAETQVTRTQTAHDASIVPNTQAGQGAANGGNKPIVGDGDVTSQFVGLPIESLICAPILAAAKGQQELQAVYIDGLMKLAYKGGTPGETNVLTFTYDRPVNKPDGTVGTETYTLNAPLLSLVPVPAFTMDELTVDFTMSVDAHEMQDDKTHSEISSTVSYNSWFGLDASITGKVSSDSEHTRSTDSSATYTIHARAVQQPPSEGMAKLTSLFAQTMEPIKSSSSK